MGLDKGRRGRAASVPWGEIHLTGKPDLDSLAAVGSQSPEPVWTKGQEQFDLLLGDDLTWTLS